MAIDPSIALGFRHPEQPSQLNMLANALQVQGLQRQNQLGQMQMEQARAGAERQGQLRNFLAQTDVNTPEGQTALQRAFPMEAPKIIGDVLELGDKRQKLDKGKVDTEAARFELRKNQIAQNLQQLGSIGSPDQAAQWIQGGVQSGLITPEQAQAELSAIPRDPQGFAQWKQAQQQAGMTIVQQMDQQWRAKDFGLEKDKFSYQQKNDAANRAVTVRGQNLTDSRAREMNATQRDLLTQQRTLQVAEAQDKADARSRAKDAAASSIVNQVSAIDMALNHPGRATGTGFSSVADPRNYIPGTDATNFKAVVDQISGAAFLQAFESLKGGGAITEIEGKKAEGAIARLKTTQSDAEFEKALKELRTVMGDGYRRVTGRELPKSPQAGQSYNGGASGGWDAAPQIKFLGFESP